MSEVNETDRYGAFYGTSLDDEADERRYQRENKRRKEAEDEAERISNAERDSQTIQREYHEALKNAERRRKLERENALREEQEQEAEKKQKEKWAENLVKIEGAREYKQKMSGTAPTVRIKKGLDAVKRAFGAAPTYDQDGQYNDEQNFEKSLLNSEQNEKNYANNHKVLRYTRKIGLGLGAAKGNYQMHRQESGYNQMIQNGASEKNVIELANVDERIRELESAGITSIGGDYKLGKSDSQKELELLKKRRNLINGKITKEQKAYKIENKKTDLQLEKLNAEISAVNRSNRPKLPQQPKSPKLVTKSKPVCFSTRVKPFSLHDNSNIDPNPVLAKPNRRAVSFGRYVTPEVQQSPMGIPLKQVINFKKSIEEKRENKRRQKILAEAQRLHNEKIQEDNFNRENNKLIQTNRGSFPRAPKYFVSVPVVKSPNVTTPVININNAAIVQRGARYKPSYRRSVSEKNIDRGNLPIKKISEGLQVNVRAGDIQNNIKSITQSPVHNGTNFYSLTSRISKPKKSENKIHHIHKNTSSVKLPKINIESAILNQFKKKKKKGGDKK